MKRRFPRWLLAAAIIATFQFKSFATGSYLLVKIGDEGNVDGVPEPNIPLTPGKPGQDGVDYAHRLTNPSRILEVHVQSHAPSRINVLRYTIPTEARPKWMKELQEEEVEFARLKSRQAGITREQMATSHSFPGSYPQLVSLGKLVRW